MLNNDLGIMSLLMGKVLHMSLDSLASLASLMMISGLTIRSTYDNKCRENWVINWIKEIHIKNWNHVHYPK